MKNKLLFFLTILFVSSKLAAENFSIEAKNITLNKNTQISIFEREVIVKTQEDYIIKSDYAEYNKVDGIIVFKNNIYASDDKNNILESNYAKYNEKNKILETVGPTKVSTSEKYVIEGDDFLVDNVERFIKSEKKSILTDKDNNRIFLDNFEYIAKNNIFKSIGFIKIEDVNNNVYEFSQIYIDTKKKEMLGSDAKSFLNDESFKINEKNKPRIFANTVKINDKQSSFEKSIFTTCDYRENDKCPPWTIQSRKMLHDSEKKTIYYDHAIFKFYDIPIFYTPKLFHPDPTVDRRSGFLPPILSNSKNLGSGVTIPYFLALDDDKNLTLTSKIFNKEHPLIIGEYQQAFKHSTLYTDFGYTEGYKNTSSVKKAGNKSHFLSKFIKEYSFDNTSRKIDIQVQNVSDDKYLKLYKIDSNLIDFETNTLENSIEFTNANQNSFLSLNASIFETLDETYSDKYEYVLPEINYASNLISNEKIGNIDFLSSFRVNNFDTNKYKNFFNNIFYWDIAEKNHKSGLNSKLLANIKNINYETKNIDIFKDETTSEIYGAIGLLNSINFQKKNNDSHHLLTPKMLIRYSPGSMRKEKDGSRLDAEMAYELNRADDTNNFENGLNSAIGFDYKIKSDSGKDFDFSIAQVINKDENKKMAQESSLDEKVSDLVGYANFYMNEKFNLNYNFAIDQNYSEMNYSEISASSKFNPFEINFGYIQEDKHIGDNEYFRTKIEFERGNNGLISFETKRNLITNSSEFYNLSYEYINDCLRAGLVYRREFYNDSELEPENSLMFKITITPFGDINSPTFTQ